MAGEILGLLRWLSLDNCELLNPNAVSWLRESKWFRGLQRLSLFGLPSASFEELCHLPPLQLHTLELQAAAFEPAAWQIFARSSTFPRLARLVNNTDMSRGGIGGAGRLRPVPAYSPEYDRQLHRQWRSTHTGACSVARFSPNIEPLV